MYGIELSGFRMEITATSQKLRVLNHFFINTGEFSEN